MVPLCARTMDMGEGDQAFTHLGPQRSRLPEELFLQISEILATSMFPRRSGFHTVINPVDLVILNRHYAISLSQSTSLASDVELGAFGSEQKQEEYKDIKVVSTPYGVAHLRRHGATAITVETRSAKGHGMVGYLAPERELEHYKYPSSSMNAPSPSSSSPKHARHRGLIGRLVYIRVLRDIQFSLPSVSLEVQASHVGIRVALCPCRDLSYRLLKMGRVGLTSQPIMAGAPGSPMDNLDGDFYDTTPVTPAVQSAPRVVPSATRTRTPTSLGGWG